MRRRVEGIVLSKSVFRERDMIARLLLRSGKRVSVLLYGGHGGGKRAKPSPVQLGYLLSVQINRVSPYHTGMYSSREYALGWQHFHIQHSYRAFCLLCFYVELILKVAPEDNLFEDGKELREGDHKGLFRVLSNSLFYLDKALAQGESFKESSLAFFLSKLIIELGITPNLKICLYSNQRLCGLNDFKLICDQGGFAAKRYLREDEEGLDQNHRGLWEILDQSWNLSFKEMEKLSGVDSCHFPSLYNYLLFHLGIDGDRIRAASLVI